MKPLGGGGGWGGGVSGICCKFVRDIVFILFKKCTKLPSQMYSNAIAIRSQLYINL